MNNKKSIILLLISTILLFSCKYNSEGKGRQNFSEIDCIEGYKFIISEYGKKYTQIFDDVGRDIKCPE